MKNYSQMPRFSCSVIAGLIIALVTIRPAMAQSSQPKIEPDNFYGPGGTKETTVSKDEYGRDVTTKRRYDGSNPKKLRSVSVKKRHYDNSGTVTTDTVYYENGFMKETQEYETNDDGTWKLVVKHYSNYDESVIGGYVRIKSKGEFRQHDWDPKKKNFKDWNDPIAGNDHKVKQPGNNSYAEICAGYNYLNRDMGPNRLNMHGINASLAWYFGGRATQTRIGLKASGNTASCKIGDRTISLNIIRMGPAISFGESDDKVIISVHLQAGIAKDGLRIEGVKSAGNSFTASAGGSLDWYFSNSLGLKFSPEVLLTKFNDQSQWNFIGAAGIVFRIGGKAN